MINWIKELKVKYKLFIAFGSILLLSIILFIAGLNTMARIISYNELAERIDALNISSLEFSRLIQEFSDRGFKEEKFLTNGESKWIKAYHEEYKKALLQLDTLGKHTFFQSKTNKEKFNNLTEKFENYNEQVKYLVNAFSERGFKDFGVEGKLRRSIHDVEGASFPYKRSTMLMLRRHEKDFFLRKDLKYLEKFNNAISEFKLEIESIDTEESLDKKEILRNVDNYKSKFNYIVALEEKIGLNIETGILGKLNLSYVTIENKLNVLTKEIKSKNNRTVKNAMILLISLLFFQIVFGLILVIFYANLLTKAIHEIKSALVYLSQGKFPETLTIRTRDEIAETKTALNNLVERIKIAVGFATNLGKGNLNIEYDERFNDDVLASAIIKMKDQLTVANEKQSAINWINEGMAKFSEILKDDLKDLTQLGDRILFQMVTYLNINQGALFIHQAENSELTRISTYAYHKKRYENQIVKVGQGIVGQCVLEKDYILLSDIPDDFVKITSGLGEATPKYILVVPLLIRDEVMGVLELASFNSFSSLSIQFVQKVSESIANILESKQITERTNHLLLEAREKAEQLVLKEEELRLSSERMRVTQEVMKRKTNELQAYIIRLELDCNKEKNEINPSEANRFLEAEIPISM